MSAVFDDLRKAGIGLAVTLVVGLGGAGLDANLRLRDVQNTAAHNAQTVGVLQDKTDMLRYEQTVQERRTALVEQKLDIMDRTLQEIRSDQRELLRRSE